MALTGSRTTSVWYCKGTCHRRKKADRPYACPLCCGFRADPVPIKVRRVPRGQRVLAVIR